ncbi:unnamed protein product [Tilletia caries]|nr:unnamed protein product [Tilletia caries]
MLTFIKFTPLDPTYKPFTFLLHPRLKRSNIIDDHLLILEHFFDDEVRIQLWGESPAIWSSRFDLGVYVNHQLLDTTPSQLHDGDIVAFPQRRYNLKTATFTRFATCTSRDHSLQSASNFGIHFFTTVSPGVLIIHIPFGGHSCRRHLLITPNFSILSAAEIQRSVIARGGGSFIRSFITHFSTHLGTGSK